MRNLPLAYVISESLGVPYDCPVLSYGQPYSAQFKSIEGDLISRATHTHGLFRDYSVDVYDNLQEYTIITSYDD